MLEKLIKKIETVMKSSRKAKPRFSLESFLYCLSIFYKAGVSARINLYKAGIFKSRELPCFVISIGNICVGGTGKTPMTIYLSRFLTTLGYKVAIVTRGYKGKLEHTGGIVSDGKKIFHKPIETGDEPYMMAQILKSPVIAGKKRYHSGMTAVKKFSPDIIVLDDAFQHLALKRNLNILLLDEKKPLGNHHLLPRGSLREPARSIDRCDAVIFTRSDPNKKIKPDVLNLSLHGIPVFRTIHVPHISERSTQKIKSRPCDAQPEQNEHYKKKRVVLFSGVADNASVKESCKKLDFVVEHQIEFTDHHWYTSNDIALIINTFKKSRADYIATTQKDFTRIFHHFPWDYPLIVFDVQIKFNNNDKIDFERFIKKEIDHYFKKNPLHRISSVPAKPRD